MISPTVRRLKPLLCKVTAQYVIALSELEIPTKTIPGNPTTHSLLDVLTKCQARRMRGLDVLGVTVPSFAGNEPLNSMSTEPKKSVQA